MCVTLSGIVTSLSAVHSSNELIPIFVIPSLILTAVILSRESYNGISEKPRISSISPVPLTVSVPLLSRVRVRLSPHVSLSAAVEDSGRAHIVLHSIAKANSKLKNFFVIFFFVSFIWKYKITYIIFIFRQLFNIISVNDIKQWYFSFNNGIFVYLIKANSYTVK